MVFLRFSFPLPSEFGGFPRERMGHPHHGNVKLPEVKMLCHDFLPWRWQRSRVFWGPPVNNLHFNDFQALGMEG